MTKMRLSGAFIALAGVSALGFGCATGDSSVSTRSETDRRVVYSTPYRGSSASLAGDPMAPSLLFATPSMQALVSDADQYASFGPGDWEYARNDPTLGAVDRLPQPSFGYFEIVQYESIRDYGGRPRYHGRRTIWSVERGFGEP
ncbi:MAG: hypothetical protein ACF8PN_13125 [Phycisphaerales bacterium]